MLQRLSIALAQIKIGNPSKNFLNEIRQSIYYLHRTKEVMKNVYNNIMNSIKLRKQKVKTQRLWRYKMEEQLYVIIMSRTRFRVNPHSIVTWMSRNALLETGAINRSDIILPVGRIIFFGKYSVCDNKKLRFITEQVACGLLSSFWIKLLLSKIPLAGPLLF